MARLKIVSETYVAILSSVKIGQVCDMHGKAERCVSSVFSRDTLCIVASG